MKVFNSTLAAIGLAAFVFASCSDSNSDPAGGTAPVINPADLTSVKLVAQQIDNSNIANYKNTTANARKFFLTRAGGTNFTTAMPTAPAKTDFKKVLNLSGPAELTNQAYAISSGKDINFKGQKINGATIFVDGTCTMQYDETTQMSNTTIVLLSSAKLIYNGTGEMIPSGCTVYCTNPRNVFSAKNDIKINGNFYANFREKKSDGSKDLITGLGAIKETTPAEKDKSITPTQNITFGSGANVFINGSIRAINLQVENGANVYAEENLFNNDNNGNATINGNLWIGGFIKTRTLDVNGYLKAVEALKVTNAFNVHDGANVEASYINVTNNTKDGDKVIAKGEATLTLNGTGKITIHNSNVITANNLVTDNASEGQITLAGENAVAVIKAHKFTNYGNSKIVAFATPGTNSTFLLQFQENYSGSTQYNTFEDLDIAATYADYDKVADKTTPNVTLVNQDHKKYGYQWSGDPATIASQAKLDLIASEESTGGQSATCIQSANNKLYVSYHTYGDKVFGGNIEVLSMTGNQLKVDANKAAENCDYNHLIVDGNSLYLAGSGKKSAGAFLGKIDLNGGNLGDEVKLYAIDNKTKMDANSVAAFDGEHIVATTKGLTSFDNEFSHWNKTGDEGKSVVVANSKLYTLDVKGNVNVYDNKNLENPIKTYNVGEVTPTNNKAVLAVDESNGTIYVCKGENGVAKISSTGDVKTDFFTCPTFTKPKKAELTGTVKGRANGIAVGREYIYVACGGYGLVVLNKEGEVVCHRKANAYNAKDNSGSANYVTVAIVNGEEYAFVAYGQNRVQVFKVTKTK
jgi:hypothetical protein